MQTKRGYAEGGFLDDGASIDAVSGNEVPTGSLQAEVRDDIPAQLSEGEFVLPADVVRFIGLEKLMQMRDKAKSGLSRMEEDGQMGGAPTMTEGMPHEMAESDSQEMSEDMGGEDSEMDAMIDGMDDDEDFDGAIQNFAEGGSVRARRKLPSYKDFTGREFGKAELIKYITYVNAAGETIQIKFLNGQAMQPIPEGYYPQGELPEGGEAVPDAVAGTGDGGGGGNQMHKNDPNNPWQGITVEGDADFKGHQIRSDKVTKNRRDGISGLVDEAAKGGDTELDMEDQKYLNSLMTEDGKALYQSRFKDPQGMDKYLTKDMTEAELQQLAQTTADTIRSQKGLPDPRYTGQPTGEIPDILGNIKELFNLDLDMPSLFKNIALMGVGTILGLPPVITKLVAKKLDVPEEEVTKKIKAAVVEQTEEEPVEEPVAPAAIAQEVPDMDPKLLAEMATEDLVDTPAVEPIEEPNIVVASEQDITLEPEEPTGVTVTNFLGEEVTSDTTEVPVLEEDSINFDIYSEDRLRILKAMDEEEDLLDSTGSETGVLADLGITEEENTEIDQARAIQRISTKLGLSLDFVTRAVQADKIAKGTLGNTDFEQVAQGTEDRLAKIEIMKSQQAKDKLAAKTYAAKVASDRAAALAAQATEKVAADKAYADAQLVKQAAIKAANDKVVADKIAADKLVEEKRLADVADAALIKIATDKAAADKAAEDKAYADAQLAKQAAIVAANAAAKKEADRLAAIARQNNGGGNGGDGDGAGRNDSNDGYGGGGDSYDPSGRWNKGGLIPPTIKKMRSDNTAGLASKKKSKERAKAKKGALAAKRT